MKTKLLYVLLLCLGVSFHLLAATVVCVSPGVRIMTDFNAGWLFHRGDINQAAKAQDSDWQTVDLPHTWNAQDAFDDTPGYYRGIGWYRKEFLVPLEWKGQCIITHFEGVNQQAEVFINGQLLGNHVGGYTAFRFDLTEHLKFGQNNLFTIKVSNEHNPAIPPLNADFTFYGGIYRNVQLIRLQPVHFDIDNNASDGVFVDLPVVNENTASVQVKGRITNRRPEPCDVFVNVSIVDGQGKTIVSKAVSLQLKTGSLNDFLIEDLEIKHPHLWSPDSPYLYKAIVRIFNNAASTIALDELTLPVGLRWFDFDEQNHFCLNGQLLKLIGTNRHQDFKQRGNALLDAYHWKDFAHIKQLGFNFVRLAHYPQSPDVYRACDKLGLLVWSEIPVVNEITQTDEFAANCLTMQREHIRQTKNHPSVIFYGYMNEVLIKMLSNSRLAERDRQKIASATIDLAGRLETLTKSEAPDRKTVMALHYDPGYDKYHLADITDVIGWNLYFGWYYETFEDLTRFLNEQHAAHPQRPMIVSEYGPGSDIRNHTSSPRPWDFSEDYQLLMHQSYLAQMLKIDFLAGFAAWNFADFGAEQRADTIPHVNQKGLVTYDRMEKEVCALYRAYFLDFPVLHIAAANNRRRAGTEQVEGSNICGSAVTVISNGSSVELKVNGRSLGKQAIRDHAAIFKVPFTNGRNHLLAIGDNGLTDSVDVDFTLIRTPLKLSADLDLAVNAGSEVAFLEPETGILWMPDQKYTPGSWGHWGGEAYAKKGRQIKVGIFENISGTESDPLFQTFIEGIQSYRFDVCDGAYRLTFCMVEYNTKSSSKELIYNLADSPDKLASAKIRAFDIEINGVKYFEQLNLARDFGPLRAVTLTGQAEAVDSNGITVEFKPVMGKTLLSGIRVQRLN